MAEEASSGKRQAILSAAERVFDAHGYAAATMDAVAQHAGTSKGSLYNYFRNKRDLFTQLFAAMLAGDEAAADQLVNEPIPATEKLHRFTDNWFDRLTHFTRVGRLTLEFWATAAREEGRGELSAAFAKMYDRGRRRIEAILTEGIEAGQFRPDIDVSIAGPLILSVFNGIIVQSILDVGAEFDASYLNALKHGLVASLSSWASTGQSQ
jgi:TetR/AcrR family fatty acid metabolism transcriptional regulator